MIPASLRRVLDNQKAAPVGDVTTIWRDGTIITERQGKPLQQIPNIPALPDLDDDNPFPP